MRINCLVKGCFEARIKLSVRRHILFLVPNYRRKSIITFKYYLQDLESIQ